MRMLSIGIITGASLAVFAAPAIAETKSRKLNASRAQVESACDANGGFAWGTGASGGRYGCMTDNAWVECDEAGDCAGGTAAGKARPRANRGVTSNIAGK